MRCKESDAPMKEVFLLISSALLVSLLHTAQAGEANHGALQLDTQAACYQAVGSNDGAPVREALRGREISLVSWNIEKGSNSGWRRDLRRLTKDAHLVMLQEAVLSEEMLPRRQEDFRFWSFSPGYQTAEAGSGVMTLSRSAPGILCSLQHQEPWLNTPKAASITRYRLAESSQDLLLVNVHQINFAFGLADFARQLEDLAAVMAQHDGPMILSGDFNTWKLSRWNVLKEITANLGFDSVTFSPDYRKRFMGNPLDHVFVRGLQVTASYTEQVRSSDHNPLILKLMLEEV
ncbi:MAG: endonuclease/exonuclease/phosphatase family protein [Gammaproteobacteria bacterium]